jgi:hypothetical protein
MKELKRIALLVVLDVQHQYDEVITAVVEARLHGGSAYGSIDHVHVDRQLVLALTEVVKDVEGREDSIYDGTKNADDVQDAAYALLEWTETVGRTS